MSEFQVSTASKTAAGLTALAGLLGVAILALDQILWSSMPTHAYALIVFVVIDFALAGYVVMKSSKASFTILVVWSIIRILLLIADVATNQMGPMTFGGYLFNPAGNIPPNPSGIPGIPIDLIVLLEIVTIGISWMGRSAASGKA